MAVPAKVNISDFIDNGKMGAFQIGVLILCGFCLMMDGFDVQSMGYVAPALTRDWKISSSVLGPVFSAALFGVLIGSILFSMLADKIGRRPVLIGLTLFFSGMTLLTARSNSIGELLTFRFIAGLGLGGLMPNAMALVGEYSPRRLRVLMMMIVSNGFTVGAAIGGFISAGLIQAYGWRSVFYFCGIVPLAIGLLMIVALPESLQFLALRGKQAKSIERWLKRIEPDTPLVNNALYVVHEQKTSGLPFIHLFHDGRAPVTVLLWVVNFMNLLNLYFLASWLPTVARGAGYSISTSVMIGAALQVGGTIGAVVLGWLAGRMGFIPLLTAGFAIGGVSIALIGLPGISLAFLVTAVLLAGFGVVGGQGGVNSLAAIYYPTELRSTGIGSGLGVGRIGAIIGPYVGGELIGLHWTSHQLFLAAAVPAVISTLVMLSLYWVMKPQAVNARTAAAVN